MSYIGNQSSKIVYTNLNRFKGTVADLSALAAVTGASSGDMYKVEDSGHAHMYDGTQWVDMGPIVGPQGTKGIGITSVIRTSGDGSEGTIDTYTITFEDTSTSTFEVRNGTAGTINHIAKTGTVGTTDTYTAYADAAKTQLLGSFEVYNGVDGISAYEVAVNNGFVGTEAEWLTSLEGQDGVDGKAITTVTFTSTTDASGLPAQSGGTDTYTISYSDASSSTYDVYNGTDVTNVSVIDDSVAALNGTWSSEKIAQELAQAGEVEEAPSDDKQYARKNAEWVEVDPIPLSQTTGTSTTTVMSQKAVTDALASKASTSTQVIAGTGLTGGGTLAANRTLNVSYGTTAGTAAQGNDSRLSNSREWTAATITQAEAEAGTATTRRAFTAQRVRQAIVAWFNGISGALGRTILTRTTAAQVRGDLGLGTAATTTNGIAIGQNIINSAVSGVENISYSGTLRKNTSGGYNTAAGGNALQENTSGDFNTAVGYNALQENTTVSFNTAIGYNALQDNTYSNCGGFGTSSAVTASNQIQLGASGTTVYVYGAVQNRSDARDKADVRDTALGLDFINAIRPVDFKWDLREDYKVDLGKNPTEEQLEANKLANIQADGTHTRKRYHHGVIAQEIASVMDTLGVDFGGFQDHAKIGGDDVLSIGYEEFIAPLIKAVQELSTRVNDLEGKVEQLESGGVE